MNTDKNPYHKGLLILFLIIMKRCPGLVSYKPYKDLINLSGYVLYKSHKGAQVL